MYPGKYSYAEIWAELEGKHTPQSKAQNVDQSERSIQPHMDQRAHQDMQPT
jgi:hypothetical protein